MRGVCDGYVLYLDRLYPALRWEKGFNSGRDAVVINPVEDAPVGARIKRLRERAACRARCSLAWSAGRPNG